MKSGDLNEKQEEAARYTDGPLLILAGAGAGKTKTITERIVHIVRKGVDPRNILAVTFTNKAAKEMRERIIHRLEEENLIGKENPYRPLPTIKTFHSLGVMILGEYGHLLGLPRFPTILDQSDTLSLIKECLSSLSLDPKLHDPSKLRNAISKEKGDFTSVREYEAKVSNSYMEIISRVWKIYEEKLKDQKAVDFDDLLVKTVYLLDHFEEVKKYYQKRFLYTHIDEYQDTNGAQYALTKLLVNEKRNLCVVGDTDQNIYSWRGANLRNILNFEKDFPGTKIVFLEENYRSTNIILSLANRAIQKNKVRTEKNLFTRKEGGDLVTVVPAYDEYSEADYVAKKSLELTREGVSPENIAILYRANFQSRVFEEAMIREGVTYNLLGTKFFERKEVKDVISYLRSAYNRDSQSDLKRVFDTPKKGIGKGTVLKVFTKEALPKSAELRIATVYRFLDSILEKGKTLSLSALLEYVIKESGIEKELREGGEDDKERLLNIYELISLAEKYAGRTAEETLPEFFEESSLMSDQDNDNKEKKGVRLMTVHASKGLEFEVVFIAGLEHDLFPHKNFGGKKRSAEEEEEERRLFYVAVTRAKKRLFLTHAELRTIFGQKQINAPSVFLDDLEEGETLFEELYYRERGENTILYF
jgi:DNA helicase-2/ATP-dependent DNA helicase PcrA